MKKIGGLFFMLATGMGLGLFWQLGVPGGNESRFRRVEARVVANRVLREAIENANEYRAEYLLEYAVDGKQHRQWERDPARSKERYRVESALGQMGPGTNLKVYVDPNAPEKVTLRLKGWEAYSGAIVFAVLGLVFAGAAVVCLLAGARWKLSSHPLLRWMGAVVAS